MLCAKFASHKKENRKKMQYDRGKNVCKSKTFASAMAYVRR